MLSHYNFTHSDSHLESVSSESKAVPDQSFTVKEILQQYRRGTLNPQSLYDPNFFYPDEEQSLDTPFEEMEDLSDISSMMAMSIDALNSEIDNVPDIKSEVENKVDTDG